MFSGHCGKWPEKRVHAPIIIMVGEKKSNRALALNPTSIQWPEKIVLRPAITVLGAEEILLGHLQQAKTPYSGLKSWSFWPVIAMVGPEKTKKSSSARDQKSGFRVYCTCPPQFC